MIETWLGLGSNEGDRLEYLQKAVSLLIASGLEVIAVSPLAETESHGFKGHDFLNAVVYGKWRGTAYELLTVIGKTESKLDRKRSLSKDYQNRTVDIDILLFGKEIIDSPDLQVPHPRMLERKFVLAPFAEFMPDVVHPVVEITVKKALAECVDESRVFIYTDKWFVRHQM